MRLPELETVTVHDINRTIHRLHRINMMSWSMFQEAAFDLDSNEEYIYLFLVFDFCNDLIRISDKTSTP